MSEDWADKRIQEIVDAWDEDKENYQSVFAQALRAARAEGMRMAAEISKQNENLYKLLFNAPIFWATHITNQIKEAAEKEERNEE